MKKVVLAFLIILILVMTFNTVSANIPPFTYFDLLITNYWDVDFVMLVLTDEDGEKTREVHDHPGKAEKTRKHMERIHSFTVYTMGVNPKKAEDGYFVVVVKMKDGNTYASETMEGSRLFENTEYVFDTELREFEEREIKSRFPDQLLRALVFSGMFVFYLAVLVGKSILGAAFNIQPFKYVIYSLVKYSILSAIIIWFYFMYVLTGIYFLIAGTIIVMALLEYRYIHKKCSETSLTNRIMYVAISNIAEIAGAALIIGIVIVIYRGFML